MNDRPVKILRIIARLNVGGPAIQVLTLARELHGGQFESLLLYGNVAEGEAEMTGYRGMDVPNKLLIPELGRELNPLKDFSTLLKIIRIIRRERPDIVHTHTAKAGAVGRAAAILCRVPVIVHTFHGHVFHGYFSPRKTALFRAIEKSLGSRTTKVVAISPLQKKEISGILGLPADKFEVIPLGFDLSQFADCRERLAGKFRGSIGAPPDAKLITIVGRITAIKNHALFLEAAKLITEKHGGVRFVIVGGGEDEQAVKQRAAELGIKDQVIFAGWREHMDEVYADTHITMLTSLNEGTPVSLIESLAASVPVVSTDVGGVADVVRPGETGLLAPSGDARALADAALKLLDDDSLHARFSHAGREDMFTRYTRGRLVRDIETLYKSLISK